MLQGLRKFLAQTPRQPSFFWRGAFIVLPVLVLTVVGLLSLRQDRLLAEAQGRQRAQELAEELANAVTTKLQQLDLEPDAVSFVVDSSGQLVFPPPKASLPVPQPLPTERLSPEQLSEWQDARTLELEGADNAKATEAFTKFLSADPPGEFAALAHYSLAQLSAQSGDYEQACRGFRGVAEKYPEALGESGLALKPLADLKWIDAALRLPSSPEPIAARAEAICSNAISRPTLLSPRILEHIVELTREAGGTPAAPAAETAALRRGVASAGWRLNAEKWQEQWRRHEQARVLFAALGGGASPAFRWLEAEQVESNGQSGHWLAVRTDKDLKVIQNTCWTTSVVGSDVNAIRDRRVWTNFTAQPGRNVLILPPLQSKQTNTLSIAPLVPILDSAASRTPPYFGYRIDLAGTPLFVPSLIYDAASISSWGRAIRAEEGTDYLVASVLLTNPTMFYAAQRQRAIWFGLLILTSAFAALFGYVSAHRAFRRQQRLAELKSNFVSSVSHELRAPIASVRLMAEGLERGHVHEPQKQKEYFRFIVQECRRLSGMIENVLDFARIDQGGKQYEMEPTDLAAVLQQTAAVMQPSATEKQISLDIRSAGEGEGPCEPSLVRADAQAIQQAVINLVDNALKHSSAGSVVRIGLEIPAGRISGGTSSASPARVSGNAPDNGEFIQIWVEDQGSGIPAEEHEKIFERFYRSGTELRRETQGVGIGLSIVKHVAEGHGGTVLVRSAPGQGSRFTIVFPYRPANGARTASSAGADYQSAVQPIANRRYVARTGSPLYRRLVIGLFGGRKKRKDASADEGVRASSQRDDKSDAL